MTGMGDETLKKIGLPEAVYDEIIEYRRMRNFGAQRRQLQLIGKKMRDMDPAAVREAIARATGESRAAVALQHRCEALRDRFLADDEAVKNFIDEHTANASRLSPQRVLANFIVCSMPISMNRST